MYCNPGVCLAEPAYIMTQPMELSDIFTFYYTCTNTLTSTKLLTLAYYKDQFLLVLCTLMELSSLTLK